jgi:hypothetical protein
MWRITASVNADRRIDPAAMVAGEQSSAPGRLTRADTLRYVHTGPFGLALSPGAFVEVCPPYGVTPPRRTVAACAAIRRPRSRSMHCPDSSIYNYEMLDSY